MQRDIVKQQIWANYSLFDLHVWDSSAKTKQVFNWIEA